MAPSGSRRSSSCPNVQLEEAVEYVQNVKDTLRLMNDEGAFQKFLKIMDGFKKGQLDITDVIVRVKSIFSHYPHLILGFRRFLPESTQFLISVAAAPAA